MNIKNKKIEESQDKKTNSKSRKIAHESLKSNQNSLINI